VKSVLTLEEAAMRALRVVGLGEDGKIVILESDRGERFQIPADERLRAAARGDITRLGQIAIELESQMRPREIQSRIRAGESVEQVAAAAGVPPERVERFAYPVLLERSRTAELAQRAHPVREDGPDVQELGEVVAQAFAARGQDYGAAVWDSWKGEDGKWVVQLTWTAGRSNNHAHWSFHPGAHGGTVTPLDDHALDLLDPNPNRGLRTVRPVTELAAQALQVAEPRRQAVNGGEPPRRVEEPDYVQDFELTDDAAPVGLVEQQELPVGDPYGRGYPRDYRPEQYRRQEPEPYRPEPEPYRPAERWTDEPARRADTTRRPEPRPAEPVRQAERPAEPVREPVHDAEPARPAERQAEPVRETARQTEPAQQPAPQVAPVREAEPVHQAEPAATSEPTPEPAAATAAPANPASPPSPPVKEPAQPRSARPTMPSIPEEQAAPAARTSSRPAETPAPAAASTASPAASPAAPAEDEEPARSTMPATEETAEETPAAKAEPTPPPAPAAPPRKKGRKARPSVPSWEDVLLGTRSNR
jgi:hypothetical protein